MQKITDFIKKQRHIITWTIMYVFIMWAILRGLFNFNMFSSLHWSYLAHMHLRGFAGLVFGLLILAALPMYVATTTLVARSGAPLFTIPIPKFLKRALTSHVPATTPADNTPPSATDTPSEKPLPDGLPLELRGAFLRARGRVGTEQFSSFDMHAMNSTTPQNTSTQNPATDIAGDLPLPSNFDDMGVFDDFAPSTTTDQDISDAPAPVFREIKFDGFDDDTTVEISHDNPESVTQAALATGAPAVTDFLGAHNMPIIAIDDDVIVTDKYAITTHDDPSFWVADGDTWFATGRQKSSPITAVTRIAAAHNVVPVLYMTCDNIMNIDARRADWEKSGVVVINDLDVLI